MKTFLRNIGIFAIVAYVVLFATGEFFQYIINATDINILNDPDFKIVRSSNRSMKKGHKTKRLVIGDSTGAQLYGDDNNDQVTAMCVSVACTMVGEYCLLSKFFENNKNCLPEEVIMIQNPMGWNIVLSCPLAYSCFAKHFYNDDFKAFIGQDICDTIDKWPYACLLNQKWFQLCPYAVSAEAAFPYGQWVSPQTWEYFKKIQALCEANNVKLRLVAGLVRESYRNQIESLTHSGYLHTDAPIVQTYFSSIKYCADDMFSDMAHLKSEHIPADYLGLYNID